MVLSEILGGESGAISKKNLQKQKIDILNPKDHEDFEEQMV